MTGVIIGIDPHKGSHTAVALDGAENKLGQLRVRATAGQVEQLRRWAAAWPDRTWAVEGARGLGHLLAQQLLACGERVVDVQPKLAARVRLLNTGAVNKNDPNDARSVAVAALRASDLREVVAEDQTAVLRLWARRYRDLGSLRTQLVCRLHAVLCELVPGGFAKKITAAQASVVLAELPARGEVDTARLEFAQLLLEDLRRIDQQRRDTRRRLTRLVAASKTTLTDIYGVGPIIAATVLGYVGNVSRSRPGTSSPPTTAPPRSRCPPATGRSTGCPDAGTGNSTTPSTWPRSARSATTAPSGGPTTTARSPRAWNTSPRCARSNAGSATRSMHS